MSWTRPNSKCKHRQFKCEVTALRELNRIGLSSVLKVATCDTCNYYYWKANKNG